MTLLQRQFANRAYWEKREREAREAYMRTEAEEAAEVDRIYREMWQHCDDEINRFYGKYADAEGIDIAEAKRRVAAEDVKAFEAQAKKYVEDRDFSAQANAELRLYNATMKINRLELLKARIGLHLVGGSDELDDFCGRKLTERAIAEITRQAGILGESITYADTLKRAKQIVSASFHIATYSERIWSHLDRLRNEIAIQLQRGMIAGVGSRQMAANLRKVFDVSVSNAHRLMVTELRRVQTDAALETYKAQGITRYVYMAVNPNACPICKAINGKDYAVSEGRIGENLPPMHPRCHCTTAPWVDEDEYEAWLSHLERGGTTEQWDAMKRAGSGDLVFRKVTSQSEAENYLKGQLSFVGATLKGMSISSINEINKSIVRLYNKYPQLKGFVQKIKVDKNNDGVASFNLNYKNGKVTTALVLNPNDLSSIDAINSMVKANVDSGYWSYCEGVEGIIEHEFGHALEAHRAFTEQGVDPFSTNVNEQIDRWQATQKYKRHEIAERELTEAFANSNIKLTENNIETYISRYAKADYQYKGDYAEAFAEAISDEKPNSVTGYIQNKARGW